MALHQLTSFTLGVPNPEETAAYYREFGLTDSGDGWFASRDGGRQLRLVTAPTRRLLELRIGADDADDLARAASRLIRLGLGRHHAGSNFFYYFKDPSGTFSEYYSDMDCVPEDQVWTPETFEGALGLFNWGPPPPPSFLHPDDLTALMAGSHSGRRPA